MQKTPRVTEEEQQAQFETSDSTEGQASLTEASVPSSCDADVAPETIVEQLKAENEEMRDRLLRLTADFDNFRKRARQQQAEQVQFANEKLMQDLLPVIDNLERALASGNTNDDIQSWKSGIELIARQLVGVLEKYGLRQVESVGATFDPARHEALGQVVNEEVPEGSIVQEDLKGYRLHERILRPAKVWVAARPAESVVEERSGNTKTSCETTG